MELVLIVVAHGYGIGRNEAANAAKPMNPKANRCTNVTPPMKQRIATRMNRMIAATSRNNFIRCLSLAAQGQGARLLGQLYRSRLRVDGFKNFLVLALCDCRKFMGGLVCSLSNAIGSDVKGRLGCEIGIYEFRSHCF